jgi:hypothetical protein
MFDWQDKSSGPAGCAARLAELGAAWGVPMPADFSAQAEQFGKEPVLAETPAKDAAPAEA